MLVPDCYTAIEVATGRTTIFYPRLDEVYATWMGRLLQPADIKAQYEVDDVKYVDEVSATAAARCCDDLVVAVTNLGAFARFVHEKQDVSLCFAFGR